MRWFVLALVFLLLGCAPSNDYLGDVYVGHDWTRDEINVIDSAFVEWFGATNGSVNSGFSLKLTKQRRIDNDSATSKHYLILRLNEADKLLAKMRNENHFARYFNNIVAIDAERVTLITHNNHDLYKTYLRKIMLHEIGHAIGLDDVKDRNAVMYESIDALTPDCITVYDLMQYCEIYSCNNVKSTCEQSTK